MGTGRKNFSKNKGCGMGIPLCTFLTAGILGMTAFGSLVWAAPKEHGVVAETVRTEIKAIQEENADADSNAEEQSGMEAGSPDGRQETEETVLSKAVQEKEMVTGKKMEEEQAPLIAIDPGHGGMDSGCVGKNITEKELNLQIARCLEKELLEKGYRVLLLREKDEFQDKFDRVEIANSYQADIFVSIHQNTYEGKDKSVGGIETWYDGTDASEDDQRLALLIHREAVKSTGARGRSVIDSGELYVVSRTLMPACLIETGFLSNPKEEKVLSQAGYQEKLAAGIARGIELYFHPGTMYLPFAEIPDGFVAGV